MVESIFWPLLHVLVFVYWLGGDLGAFYSSQYLTRPGVPAAQRLLAARIVGAVDMAPRTALILALPTGLSLAIVKGWIGLPNATAGLVQAGVWLLSLAWLLAAWQRHLSHGQAQPVLQQFDMGLRLILIGLGCTALALSLSASPPWPMFVALKLACLAVATGLGLLIRRVLTPLGPALAGLSVPERADAAEASLAVTLRRARPLVVGIWICLIVAACLGFARQPL